MWSKKCTTICLKIVFMLFKSIAENETELGPSFSLHDLRPFGSECVKLNGNTRWYIVQWTCIAINIMFYIKEVLVVFILITYLLFLYYPQRFECDEEKILRVTLRWIYNRILYSFVYKPNLKHIISYYIKWWKGWWKQFAPWPITVRQTWACNLVIYLFACIIYCISIYNITLYYIPTR